VKDIDNTIRLINNDILYAASVDESGELNGAVYAVDREFFLKTGILYGSRYRTYVMPNSRSADIDYENDLKRAEKILRNKFMKNKDMVKIGSKMISKHHPCFIIAEAGVNHQGSLTMAKQMIDAAANAGADAIKFQTFNPDEGTSKFAEKVAYQKSVTESTENQYSMLKKLQLSESDFKELKKHCYRKKIIFLSTASDKSSVDIVTRLNVSAYKVASPDITNIPLLKYIAKMNKPIILSTGCASMMEISDAVEAIMDSGNNKIVLLQCVSKYPMNAKEANIKVMGTLHDSFNTLVGYSDHSIGIEVPLAAVMKGASIIEKHFTLNKKLPGPDHKVSLNPKELKQLVRSIRIAEEAIGNGIKKPLKDESEVAKQCRKSIVVLKDTCKGTKITKEIIGIKKPCNGILPKNLDNIMGRILNKDLPADKAINWGDLD